MMTDLLMLVPQMLHNSGDSEEAREQAVFAGWLIAAGSALRKVTAPVRLERKTLIIAVRDDTWRTQLMAMRGQALFKLNSLLGAPLVTGIEYVVNPDLVFGETEAPHEFRFTAPEEQVATLRERADQIPDSEIRRAFLNAAGKCLERRSR